ncbi:MAG TPA: hypothetical protein VLZ12_01765 [Verrucomicrobiae bacterium]|nr:hypothetical protein [Verrucomicrobiae bacterium]
MTVLGMLCAVSAAIAADAKVEEREVGPVGTFQDVNYVVSPHGVHLASVARKGSRMNVIVDGVAGPKFDEIITPTAPWVDPRGPMAEAQAAGTVVNNLYPSVPVTFSNDGKRYAYLGRQGTEWVLIADGKELIRTPVEPNQTAAAGMQFTGDDGKHLLFASSTFNGRELWVDGQKMPGTYNSGAGGTEGTTDPLISPDGSRYAYVAQIGRDKRTVIVDGKDAGFLGDNLAFTADSQHLFALVRQGPVVWLAVDGKPKIKTDGINQLVMAPTGNGFAAVLQRLNPPGQFLVFNGKKVEGSDCPTFVKVVISPDGKHFAALCSMASNVYFVLADGKKGQQYDNITADSIAFSPDSAKLGYVASSAGKFFVVINEDESDAFQPIPAFFFSADGKRTVYSGLQNISSPNSPGGVVQGFPLVIDGKVLKLTRAWFIKTFVFSPDTSRYGFTGGGGPAGPDIFLDGKPSGLTGNFLFSPDSKHVVCVGYRPTENKHGIFLDGKLVHGIEYDARYRAFTPDSQHLLWMAREPATGANASPGSFDWVTYVDGKPAARCDATPAADQIDGWMYNQFQKSPPAWEMGADGVLTLVGPVGDVVKRFKITPSSDTSLTTMLAGAAK